MLGSSILTVYKNNLYKLKSANARSEDSVAGIGFFLSSALKSKGELLLLLLAKKSYCRVLLKISSRATAELTSCIGNTRRGTLLGSYLN
jgi:hypothetical protein